MKLALFDLDHTLIPFDSGMQWTRFLVARGALPPDAVEVYLGYCREYVAGTLDIYAMHRASVAPLAAFEQETLDAFANEFEATMAPLVPSAMCRLVATHRDAGDLCALVTATDHFIAAPFGRLFGIAHVLATRAQCVGGRYTGAIDGLPCYREHKLTHVRRWLDGIGTPLESFERSSFYSDSASDLPLLLAVTDPVAVRPDTRLLAHAQAAGWRIILETTVDRWSPQGCTA